MVRKLVVASACLLVIAVLAAPALAQSRTWVSGVGNDANPCSRTAPCKTFAGAISKTSTGGEINVLDPGGFGAVTITKSITISSEGFEAGVLVSGSNGIIINAAASSHVVLRGLDFEGQGTGTDGIKVTGALASLHIEKCTINNFRGTNASAIDIAPTTAGTVEVHIEDTIVRTNGQGTGGGIRVNPSAGVTVKLSMDRVQMLNNTFGYKSEGAGAVNASIHDSVVSNNDFAGLSAVTSGHILQFEKGVVHGNGTGVSCSAGTSVRLGSSSITGNSSTVAGTCSSYKNNDIDTVVALTPINPQ